MWFKLIAGASHTDSQAIAQLVQAYLPAGIDCIDIACDIDVLEIVSTLLASALQPSPRLMISVPLDPDPHFQKIQLEPDACTGCGLCVPLCPADALTLPTSIDEPADPLLVSNAKCYGCNRCVPVCPTQALTLQPFFPDNHEAVLSHPMVQAVEIHTRYADVAMLATYIHEHKDLLANKWVSLCFSPWQAAAENWLACLTWLATHALSGTRWLIQVDGQPMSGTSDLEASRPALEGARLVWDTWHTAYGKTNGLVFPGLLTVSGGINQHTPQLLKDPAYAMVQGVAMGTMARRWVQAVGDPASHAKALVNLFSSPSS